METIVELLKSPWFWFVIAGSIAGMIGYVIYPQQTHTDYTSIANDYISNQGDVIDVFIEGKTKTEALTNLAAAYPDYTVIEIDYIDSKKIWLARLEKREGSDAK